MRESQDSFFRTDEVNPAAVAAALEVYLAEPGITPDQHIRRLMIGLGQDMSLSER